MKSEILSQEKNIVTLKVTIPQDDFQGQLKKTYASVAARANIPGFRRGKAPKNIIEMRFGKEALMAEALEALVPGTLKQLVSEYDMDPIDEPELSIDTLKSGEDVVFTVKFEVRPEVTLPDLSAITVERPVFEVSEQAVDDAINHIRWQKAVYQKVDRASKHRDQVKAAYSTTILDDDGSVIASHEAQIETFTLEKISLRPEISAALTGVVAGDKREADLQVDPDFRDAKVAGKRAHYDFDIIEVLEPILPELDEEFLKSLNPTRELHNEEELRSYVREDIEGRFKAEAQKVAENDAIKKVVDGAQIDLPDSTVQRQKEELRRRYEENLQQRLHKSIEEHYADRGQDLASFETELDRDAKDRVKTFFVMDGCAREYGVSVGSEDLDLEVEKMAASYHIAPESVKAMLRKRPEDLENLLSSARYRKTVDAIMAKVNVVDVPKSLPANDEENEKGE